MLLQFILNFIVTYLNNDKVLNFRDYFFLLKSNKFFATGQYFLEEIETAPNERCEIYYQNNNLIAYLLRAMFSHLQATRVQKLLIGKKLTASIPQN
jgi:hypothetical protein